VDLQVKKHRTSHGSDGLNGAFCDGILMMSADA
jgi:hypothetical protein